MKTIRLLIDLTYDDEKMHGDDPAAEWWFKEEILKGGSLVLFDNGIGEDVGHVKIVHRNPPPVDDKTSPTPVPAITNQWMHPFPGQATITNWFRNAETEYKSSPIAEDMKALEEK